MPKKKLNEMDKDEEKTMKEFIIYLFKGYLQFGHNKYAYHILRIANRYLTCKIGECKNFYISEKAEEVLGKFEKCDTKKNVYKALRKRNKDIQLIKEHKIPAKKFFDEFKTKKEERKDFTIEDAERWFRECTIAIITKEEDNNLSKAGYMVDRFDDAYDVYDKVGIKLIEIKQ
jgi:hypothetical protein